MAGVVGDHDKRRRRRQMFTTTHLNASSQSKGAANPPPPDITADQANQTTLTLARRQALSFINPKVLGWFVFPFTKGWKPAVWGLPFVYDPRHLFQPDALNVPDVMENRRRRK